MHDEYMLWDMSLAFRKPTPSVAAASRRPARADAPKVGLDGRLQASAPGEIRGALGRLGYPSGLRCQRRDWAGRQCLSRRRRLTYSTD